MNRGSSVKVCKLLLPVLLLLAGQACQGDQPSRPGATTSASTIFADPLVTSNSTYLGPANSAQTVTLGLVLSRDEAALDAYLEQLSTPASPNYRRFLTASGISDRFGPTSATQQAVLSFMQGYGVMMTLDASGLAAYGPASLATLSQIFSISFGQYSRSTGTFIAPMNTPTLPQGLQGLVIHVLGLSTEPALSGGGGNGGSSDNTTPVITPNPPASNVISQNGSPTSSGTRSGCTSALAKNGFTPAQIRTAYGIEPLRNAGFQGQGIYMALVEESLFLQSNINEFATCFGITNAVTPQVITIGTAPTSLSDEPHLDIEVILSVAPQISGLYVFQSQLSSYADWANLYGAPLDQRKTGGNRVTIVSSSLGKCELHWTSAGISAMEKVLKNLAAAGISVFTSAGDSGSSDCYHSDGTTRSKTTGYPATSAYVTAVGGTNLALNAANVITGSGVWNQSQWPSPYASVGSGGGGGISTMISRPPWQTGTGVETTERTVPDVAMYADQSPGYVIYGVDKNDPSTNKWFDDGGTSAATPLTASGVVLLHQKAAQNGVTLDLAHVWLYRLANNAASYQSAFYDITVGNNNLFNVGCCNAGVGYDLASGWGSVNFSVLASLLVP